MFCPGDEFVRLRHWIVAWYDLQNPLVNGAEFFRAEVAEVNGPPGFALGLDDGQVADAFKQCGVGQLEIVEQVEGPGFEKAAEGIESEFAGLLFAAK